MVEKRLLHASLFLSVITILELEKSVLGLARRDARRNRLPFSAGGWTENVLAAFSGRILGDRYRRGPSLWLRSMFPILDLIGMLSFAATVVDPRNDASVDRGHTSRMFLEPLVR